jgi:NHLM bacteriocin system ABC transporter ATP-binding protein
MSRARTEPARAEETLALDPRRPVRLDRETRAFLVTEGSVDVFARAPDGPRRPLFRVVAGEALFGVPGEAPVEVLAVGDAGLLSARPEALSAELVARWNLRLADAVGEPTLEGVGAWLAACSRRETLRIAQRLERDERVRGGMIGRLARLITPAGPLAASAGAEEEPLFAACSAVAQAMRLPPLVRPSDPGPDDDMRGVLEIVRASGLRVRRTALRGGWWREEVGPLLAWRGEDRRPVAVVPRRRGGYLLFDPASGAWERLSPSSAAELSADAASFYRPLPAGPLTLRGLLAWVGGAAAGDLRRLLLAAMAAAAASLAAPALTGVIVDQAILRSDVGTLAFCALALLAAAFGSAGFLAMQSLALLRLGAASDALMQGAVTDKLLRLPIGFFKGYSAGDLADRIFGVAGLRQVFTGRALGGLLAAVFCLFSFALMFALDARLALVALGLGTIQLAVIVGLARRQLRHERSYAAAQGRVRALVLQMLAGVGKLRVAAATGRVLARWTEGFAEQVGGFVRARRVSGWLIAFNSAFPVLATLVLFAVAGGGSEAGRFLAFFAAFGQALATLVALGLALGELLAAAPALERIWPVLAAEAEPRPPGGSRHVLSGAIELRNIRFAYDPAQRLVLKDLSFSVAPGEFVALVGPSGGGKSTILRILLGFERPASGSVTFDGRPIETLDMTTLRRQIGVVLQDGRLFSGSLYENICGAAPAPEEDVLDAVRRAGLEPDVAAMPMGLHTVITEGAAALSGGQKQRLLIARALVHRPKLLLFDEATSALDNRTQAVVAAALSELSVTRIAIAHRLSTIREADRILVVDRGQVVQDGSYDTLMAQPGLFAELARRQLA